jgi:hypothetical protein
MSIDSHLSELVRRHQTKKLQLKDEIERLKQQMETAPAH